MDQELSECAMHDAAATDRTPPPGAPVAEPARQAAETRRLYAGDWDAFAAWAGARQHHVLPAAPETVAAYLRAFSATLSAGALARRAAAIADRHRRQNLPSPSQDEIVRHVLRAARDTKRKAIATPLAARTRRPAQCGPTQLLRMAARCPGDLAGLRDRALLLLTAAGLRGETLLALDHEHVQFMPQGLVLAIPKVGTPFKVEPASLAAFGEQRAAASDPTFDPASPAALAARAPETFVTARLAEVASCPVRALERWLEHSETRFGPVFRKVNRWNGIEHARLRTDALRRIWQRRAAALRPTPASPSPRVRAEDAA